MCRSKQLEPNFCANFHKFPPFTSLLLATGFCAFLYYIYVNRRVCLARASEMFQSFFNFCGKFSNLCFKMGCFRKFPNSAPLCSFIVVLVLVFSAIFCFYFNFSTKTQFELSQLHDQTEFLHLEVIDSRLQNKAKDYVEPGYVSDGCKFHSVKELAAISYPPVIIPRCPCGGNNGEGLLGVFEISSKVDHFELRNAIRLTYGRELKEHPEVQMYFSIAQSDDKLLTSKLHAEAEANDDIIQFPAKDNYYNLTLKSVGCLRFSAEHCSMAKHIIKLDDDMYVNVPNTLAALRLLPQDAVFGKLKDHPKVEREGRYKVDKRDFPDDVYPIAHNGVYAFPGNVSLLLYQGVITTPGNGSIQPAVPFEDIYVTGILSERMNITRKKFPGLVHQNFMEEQADFDICQSSVIYDKIDPDQMLCFHNKAKKCPLSFK